ncbi:MAG: hydroxymethylbilane synthase, partial [Cytophagales bacterium]
MKIKIGTRSSKLALWQAHWVSDQLKSHGATTEILHIETKGDKILDRSLHKIGSKGLFTEELENQLLDGTIDIAVHSAKDVQSSLIEGLSLIAFSEREQNHDVLISKKPIEINNLSKYVIGTSSTRRRAFLRHLYPDIQLVESRGNLQTRISKMENGEADALVLAFAGVHRMEYDSMIVHHFDKKTFVPPVGQGCLAIEASDSLDAALERLIRKAINHEETEICMKAERAFLARLSGGCSIPSFSVARKKDHLFFEIIAGLISLDGKKKIEFQLDFVEEEAEKAGVIVAEKVLQN